MTEDEPQNKRPRLDNNETDFLLDVKGVQFLVRKTVLEERSNFLKRKLLEVSNKTNCIEIQDENPLCVCKCLCLLHGECVNGGIHITWPKKQFSCLEEIIVFSDVPSLLDLAFRWEIQTLQEEIFSYMYRSLNARFCTTILSLAEKYSNAHLQVHCKEFMQREEENGSPDFVLDVKGVRFSIRSRILIQESALMKVKLIKVPMGQNHFCIHDENPLCVCKCLCILERRYVNGGNHIMWQSTSFFSVEQVVALSDVSALLDLASRWEIPRLQHEMFLFLQNHLSMDTFYLVNSLEEKYCNSELRFICNDFLARNFCHLCENPKFLHLSEHTIMSLLKSAKLKTRCWTLVFERIISWIERDERRRHHFEEIFCSLNLTNFTPEYLEKHVETNELVKSNATCLENVRKAYRAVYEKSEGLIVSGHLSSPLKVHYPFTRRSFSLESCSSEHAMGNQYSIFVFKKHLYAFMSNQSVFRLGLMTSNAKWEKIASTNDYHEEFPRVTDVDGHLFVLGGGKVMIDTCEKYLIEQNLWQRVSALKMQTENYGVASVGGIIYIIGVTKCGIEPLPSAEKFCPTSRSLCHILPTRLPMFNPSTATLKQTIYATGSVEQKGSLALNIECLDTEAGTWTTILHSEQDAYCISSICATQRSLFCFGFEREQASYQDIYAWERSSIWSLPTRCHHMKVTMCSVGSQLELVRRDFQSAFCGIIKPYDVIIKVDGKEFPAHKSVLSLHSDYFNRMFKCKVIENQTNVVHMKNNDSCVSINSCVVRQGLDFAYGAECSEFTLENVEDFLNAASYMQIHGLLQKLALFMESHLNEYTFKHFKHLSHKYCIFEVEDACDNYGLENFNSITGPAANCLGTMEKKYFSFLLHNRKTETNDEFEAYKSIVRWVRSGDGVRDCYFGELLSSVKLEKIPEFIVRSDIAAEELVRNDVLCQNMVEESLQRRKELHEVICIIHGRRCKNSKWNFVVYSPRLQKWTTIWEGKTLPLTSIDPISPMVRIGRHFYFLKRGKFFRLAYQNRDPSWQLLTQYDLPSVGWKTVANTNDCLFVVQRTAIIEYNTIKKQWRTILVSVDRDKFTTVSVGKCIYILGGTVFGNVLSTTIQRYDTESEYLLNGLSGMQQPRCGPAAAHFGGKIFVTGGWNPTGAGLKSVEFYDISADCWNVLPDMHFPRLHHTALVIDGQLYVIGGDMNSPRTMEHFDDKEQTWEIEVISKAIDLYATCGHIPYELLC